MREKLKYHWIYEFVEIWQHFNQKYSTWKYPFHEIDLLQIQNKNTTFNSYLKTFFQSLSLRNLVGHRSLVPTKINLTKGWDQMKPNSYCWRQKNKNKMFGLIKARLKLSQSWSLNSLSTHPPPTANIGFMNLLKYGNIYTYKAVFCLYV